MYFKRLMSSSTLFWMVIWVDGPSLEVRFRRLYELSESKLTNVFFGMGCEWRGL